MRYTTLVIPFVLVCLLSSGLTALVLTQATAETGKTDQPEALSAPPGFVAKRTANGSGIFYQRQDIAALPSQNGTAAFAKAMSLSEQAKCRLAMAQDRSSRDPAKVQVTDEYCRQLLAPSVAPGS